jgi:hypothetical protein
MVYLVGERKFSTCKLFEKTKGKPLTFHLHSLPLFRKLNLPLLPLSKSCLFTHCPDYRSRLEEALPD